jgi:DnaJ-class molecular chaperone
MVKETKLYDVLGVSPDADDDQIKRAYKKSALKWHPDRNRGDESAKEKFQQVQKAYEILSDAKKRALYDRRGAAALEEDGRGGGGGGGSLFDHLFGGGGGGRGPRKTDDVQFTLPVDLEALYKGKESKLSVKRDVLCSGCHGSGAKAGKAPVECRTCGGRGQVIRNMQIQPGFVQRMASVCPACNGSCETLAAGDRCGTCSGRKVAKTREIIQVYIDKGMKAGQKIYFRGKADEHPDMEPGDIIVTLEEKPHPTFRRDGDDLHMTLRIPIVEALTSTSFTIKHLDDRELLVKDNRPNTLIKAGDTLCIKNEGMPVHKDPFIRGDLFITFALDFPAKPIRGADVAKLEALLGKRRPEPIETDEVEEVELTTIDPADLERRKREARLREQARKEAYHDDDDEEGPHMHGMGGGGPGVQCAQQ